MRFILFITALVATIGCQNHKKATAEADAAITQDTLVVVVEKAVEPKDSLVISFDKTPCFGRCPVYKVKVYRSGFALYEGINFAEKMGMYSTKFTQEQIEAIYQDALAIGYFELKSEYDDQLVTDLPSTISRINYNGQDKRIKARYQVPQALKDFHNNLAVTLLEKDWKSYNYR